MPQAAVNYGGTHDMGKNKNFSLQPQRETADSAQSEHASVRTFLGMLKLLRNHPAFNRVQIQPSGPDRLPVPRLVGKRLIGIIEGGNIAGFLFLDILIMSQGDDHSRDRTFDSSVIIITHKEIHIILFKAAVIRKIAL